ncbi:hypothetical protein QUF72_00225 [Desulfobacterales bacterium HSG2]|nr:hypothetical protein [Desulfobacterales bacterium HSG2]
MTGIFWAEIAGIAIKHQASGTKHQASGTRHQASSYQASSYQASSYQASSIKHQASKRYLDADIKTDTVTNI